MLDHRISLPKGRVTTTALVIEGIAKLFPNTDEHKLVKSAIEAALRLKEGVVYVVSSSGSSITLLDAYLSLKSMKEALERSGSLLNFPYLDIKLTVGFSFASQPHYIRSLDFLGPDTGSLVSEKPTLDRLDKWMR